MYSLAFSEPRSGSVIATAGAVTAGFVYEVIVPSGAVNFRASAVFELISN